MIRFKKEKPILERCKRSDNQAFKQLYDLYVKAMYNISLRIVNNKEEAEDILQNSFSKAFKQIQQFENEKAFAGWLKRVVINNSIDVIRKHRESFLSIDDIQIENPIEDELENEISFSIESIQACMQELPDGYRVVFTLYLFENMTHKEIGTSLNISEGTSKSQFNRAKKRLIQLLYEKQAEQSIFGKSAV
jgi:RNA polymerase sigma factor (sigma-70 family)